VLAFDTIYAEGAAVWRIAVRLRASVPRADEKPDVDLIDGLSPAT
jgi:excinuclease UvrABC ATPase subunit